MPEALSIAVQAGAVALADEFTQQMSQLTPMPWWRWLDFDDLLCPVMLALRRLNVRTIKLF